MLGSNIVNDVQEEFQMYISINAVLNYAKSFGFTLTQLSSLHINIYREVASENGDFRYILWLK